MEPHLPRPLSGRGRPGRPARNPRWQLEGMLWLLRSGVPWRCLPARYGPWQTVYDRFSRWRRAGVFSRIVSALQGRLWEAGLIDHTLWCVDGTNVRAARCAAGARQDTRQGEPHDHGLGRSRGGFGTKLHLVTDGRGTPLAAAVTPGQTHESKALRAAMAAARRRPDGTRRQGAALPQAVAGDRAYSCAWIRTWLRKRGIERVIPQRSDQVGRRGGHRRFDPAKYRRRHVIEQCVGWLKELRRIGTRYEKLAVNYLAMVGLGFVVRYLRLLCPQRTRPAATHA